MDTLNLNENLNKKSFLKSIPKNMDTWVQSPSIPYPIWLQARPSLRPAPIKWWTPVQKAR